VSEAPQLLVQTGRENEVIDSPRPISFDPLRVADIGGYGAAGIALTVTARSPTATVTFPFGGSYRPFSQGGFDARFGIRPAPALTKPALISLSSTIIVGPFRCAVCAGAMRVGTGFASPGRTAIIITPGIVGHSLLPFAGWVKSMQARLYRQRRRYRHNVRIDVMLPRR
jgi:hypothetical protein